MIQVSLSFYHHRILLKICEKTLKQKTYLAMFELLYQRLFLFKLTLRCKNGQQGSHSKLWHQLQRLQTSWKDFCKSLSVEGSKGKDRSSTCCLLRDKTRFLHKSAKIFFSKFSYFVSEKLFIPGCFGFGINNWVV